MEQPVHPSPLQATPRSTRVKRGRGRERVTYLGNGEWQPLDQALRMTNGVGRELPRCRASVPVEGLVTFRVAVGLNLDLHLTGSLQPREGTGATNDRPCAGLLPIFPRARGEADPQGALGAAKGSVQSQLSPPGWSRNVPPGQKGASAIEDPLRTRPWGGSLAS